MFASVGGVMYAYFNHFISPDRRRLHALGHGGADGARRRRRDVHRTGVGTSVYMLIQNLLSSYTDRWQLVLGVLFVFFVLFVRGGVIGMWAQSRTWNGRTQA